MRVLIDVLHPAHVHFFRHFTTELRSLGHEVLITARDKDLTLELLEAVQMPAEVLSRQRTGPIGLASEMATRTFKLLNVARKWKPDVLAGIMGPSIAVVGRLTSRPAVVFYDTEMAAATNRWVYPLATNVATPESYAGPRRSNQVTYNGYHELAYLHPSRFTPDRSILSDFGLVGEEPFSILRFVSWQASHDFGEVALTPDQKRLLVRELQGHGKVLISSEGPLPRDLEDNRISGPLEHIHHLLSYATILVGESATMSSEASVLGVPSVFISKTSRGYIDDQERRYGLVRHVKPAGLATTIQSIKELSRTTREWRDAQRYKLLHDNIDVTAWMVEFVSQFE
jgi:uncharacterized protein